MYVEGCILYSVVGSGGSSGQRWRSEARFSPIARQSAVLATKAQLLAHFGSGSATEPRDSLADLSPTLLISRRVAHETVGVWYFNSCLGRFGNLSVRVCSERAITACLPASNAVPVNCETRPSTRVAMPPKKGKKDQELHFVVTTNPNEANTAANRKRVRSQAALKSWPERRKRTLEQLEFEESGSGTSSTFLVRTPETDPATQVADENPKKQNNQDRIESIIRFGRKPSISTHPTSSLRAPSSSGAASAVSIADDSTPCTRTAHPDSPCSCFRCLPERRVALSHHDRPLKMPQSRKRRADGTLKYVGDLAMLTPPHSPPSSGRTDPFNCYPVPYKPWMDSILHHMMTVFAPRGWPALKITNDQGRMWEHFMTQHALAEPALFYVRLLFATGDLIKLNVLKPELSYWIQGEAIKAINEALKDPDKAISDPLILAVGRISWFEHMYGSKQAANTIHRPAQARMIQMRGGMKSLDFPDLVKRLMRLTDTIMSKTSGSQRFIEEESESGAFSLEQAANVSERWFPTEGRELSRKIRITDLVSE